jgi:hypothetical protein
VMRDVVGGRQCLSVIFISALRSLIWLQAHRRSLPLMEPSLHLLLPSRVLDEIEYVFQ